LVGLLCQMATPDGAGVGEEEGAAPQTFTQLSSPVHASRPQRFGTGDPPRLPAAGQPEGDRAAHGPLRPDLGRAPPGVQGSQPTGSPPAGHRQPSGLGVKGRQERMQQIVTIFATMRPDADGGPCVVIVERTSDFGQFVTLVLGFRRGPDCLRLIWRVEPAPPPTTPAAGRPELASLTS